MNLYNYLNGDPLNATDPTGMQEEKVEPRNSGGCTSFGNGCTYGPRTSTGGYTYRLQPQFTEETTEGVSFVGEKVTEVIGTLTVGTSSLAKDIGVRVSLRYGLRGRYIKAVGELKNTAHTMRADGVGSEKIARTLHAARRQLGVKYKSLTPKAERARIYARNLEKYGDRLGPSIDYLRSSGKSWDDIVNSATRSGGKDLGY